MNALEILIALYDDCNKAFQQEQYNHTSPLLKQISTSLSAMPSSPELDAAIAALKTSSQAHLNSLYAEAQTLMNSGDLQRASQLLKQIDLINSALGKTTSPTPGTTNSLNEETFLTEIVQANTFQKNNVLLHTPTG